MYFFPSRPSSSASATAAGKVPALGCPAQEQSSQSSMSDTVPLTKAADAALSFCPPTHDVALPPSPPFRRSPVLTALSVKGTCAAASDTPTVCSVMSFARSTTSPGRPS